MRRALLLAVGVALFALLLYVSGVDKLSSLLHPNVPLALIAGVFVAAQLFVFAMRWQVITKGIAEADHVPAFDFFFYAVSSLAMGQFIPQTASLVVVRSAMLNRFQGISLRRSVLSVILDKFLDLLMIVLLIGPVLLFVSRMVSVTQAFVIALGFLGIGSVVFVLRHALWSAAILRVVRFAGRLLTRVPLLAGYRARLEQLQHLEQWDALHDTVVRRAYWLTLLGQALMVLRTWFIAQAVGTDLSLVVAFLAVAFAQASILIAITPGALGIMEASWYVVLAVGGVPSEQIAVFMVAHRVFTAITLAVLWLVLYSVNTGLLRLKTDRARSV